MLNFIRKANARYDKLPEPSRFLHFIVPTMVALIFVAMCPLVGWSMLLLLIAFRLIGKYF